MRHVLYCSERHVQIWSETLEMDRMARAWGACDVTGVVGGEGQRGLGGRGRARGQQMA